MKNFILISLFLIGCNSETKPDVEVENISSIDSLIIQSQKNLISLDSASKSTDSSISGKVEKTVKQINTLKQEVTQLKQENNELKVKINNSNDVGKPFKLLPVSNSQDNK